MRIAREDWKRLGLPAAAAVVLAAIGAAAVALSANALLQARADVAAAQADRLAAQDRLAKASEEEREIRENLAVLARMEQRGIVGPENRLDWIDTIARIKTERKLLEIRYNIEPQRLLDFPGIVPTAAMEFVDSRMKLQMALLHEGDLLDFLADFSASAHALVSVRRCSVTRAERATPSAQGLAPRLAADCELDLITLKEGKTT